MIEVSHLTRMYGARAAVKDLSFTVEDGQIYGLLGPNGAGKSTIMNILAGYLAATSGTVTVCGHPLPEEAAAARACIGYLPETPPLYPEMTVEENLEMGAYTDPSDQDKTMEEVYQRFPRLRERRRQLAGTLSGGEQQRVGLARALVNNPKLIIADEPTGNIDPALSFEIVDLLSEINRRGTTILMVTHEHSLVKHFHKRVVEIHDGRIVADTASMEVEPDAQD